MKIITNTQQLQQYINKLNTNIGFVPTMGALHEGHISLIKKAREQNNIVVVSIFVNPTQFLAHEDLDSYPKKQQADIKICELLDVDVLFMPKVNEMYDKDEILIKAPNNKSYILEGFIRPGHFDGVLQIVLKLFNLIKPNIAYFGKKDAQQLYLIKQMVKNLFLDIQIEECELIREKSGLALSSRNTYLSEIEKKEAMKISSSLKTATILIQNGTFNAQEIIKSMKITMNTLNIQYIQIVTRNFEQIDEVEIKNTIILVAVKVGNIRLIDNIWI